MCQEVLKWKTLRNKNVVQLLGIAFHDPWVTMVWDWMENGSITEFIKSHVDANRFELVGLKSCC